MKANVSFWYEEKVFETVNKASKEVANEMTKAIDLKGEEAMIPMLEREDRSQPIENIIKTAKHLDNCLIPALSHLTISN